MERKTKQVEETTYGLSEEEVSKLRSQPEAPASQETPVDFLHSGSTRLNLAASNKARDGGWARGRIVNIVGDGSVGKTLLALEAAANAFYNMLGNESHNFPKVEKVTVVYNNVEGVMDFPIELMYGKEFNEGVEWVRTGTVQGFGTDFFNRVGKLKSGHFMLYILDTWDALDSEEEMEAFLESVKKEKPQEGSYDLGKQRYASKRFFKTLCNEIEGSGEFGYKDCTLMIISQTRKKIGVTFGEQRYRAGGDSLNFYTHQVCWLAQMGPPAYKTSQGEKVTTGVNIKAKFKRNKTAKPFREAEFSIVFDYGLDDITSMIWYIWGPKTKEVGFDGKHFLKYETLVKYIEDNNLEDELVTMTEEKWRKIEKATAPDRKKRF